MHHVGIVRACRAALALLAFVSPVARAQGGGHLPAALRQADSATTGPVEAEMHHLHYRATARIALDIADLRGALIPTHPPAAPWLEDATSFVIAVDSAVIGITAPSLTALLNDYVFRDDDAPLKDLSVSIDKGALTLKGKLRTVAGLPFTIVSSISPTSDGRIRLHPTKVKVIGVRVGWLMHMLSVKLDQFVSAHPGRGVTVAGNDFILDPATLLPPPSIRGRVAAARVGSEALVLTFGNSHRPGRTTLLGSTEPSPRNFVMFRGAVLRFGKLTMHDTDLRIVDADQTDPFDFYFDRLDDQLVAGFVRTMADFSLVSTMPDYADMVRDSARASRD